ncbi:MAG: XRE family transcriptional regulator [Clostridia bacterium]|nr:XRE family transcriptional regulator [Clostridia bacterium]
MRVGIGEKIRKLRRQTGKRQEDLAEALGVTSQAVSRWETGGSYPDLELIPGIADFFGVAVGELFDREEKEIFTAAVDVGGTKIACGIADEGGNVLAEASFPTPTGEGSAETAAKEMARTIRALSEKAGVPCKELRGIGVFSAGPVDPARGTVENPYTLPGWEGFPLTRRLSALTGLPVKLDNDANGALLGEVKLRELAGKRVLMVTLGTGVGAAFFDGEKLYRAGRFHPELGHVIVSSEGEKCYCGRRGCLESRASGKAMNARAREAGYADFPALKKSAEAGEGAARKLLGEILGDLRNGIWTLALLFKPEILILAGGISAEFFPLLRDAVGDLSDGKEDFVPPFRILPAFQNRNPALAGASNLYGKG